MKLDPRTFGTTAAVVLLAIDAHAHRLDEYLQAARLSLAHDRVALELDLTPGVAIAPDIISMIDRDADLAITPQEAQAYGQEVVSETVVTLNGGRVAMTLDRIEIPPADDLRTGLGTIAVRASGDLVRLAGGRHTLQYQNNHQPGRAVYLINALAPDNPSIRVVSQRRDSIQREGRIEYEIQSSSTAPWFWLVAAVACFHRQVASLYRRVRHKHWV